jgi:hypothetical protein
MSLNPTPSLTPNVGPIQTPKVRRIVGVVLYVLMFLASVAGLFFSIFPELAFGTDLPARIILFVTSLVSLAGSTFGVFVTTPNVPKS